ncbi:hypothetical protein VTN96DRAFT_1865 [Rasamsonia emersonii]
MKQPPPKNAAEDADRRGGMRAEHYLATTGKALVDVRGRSTNDEGGGRSGTTVKNRRQPWESASLVGCRNPEQGRVGAGAQGCPSIRQGAACRIAEHETGRKRKLQDEITVTTRGIFLGSGVGTQTADRPSGESGLEGIWPWLGKRGHLGDWRPHRARGDWRWPQAGHSARSLGGTLNPAGRMTRRLDTRRVAATGLLWALSVANCECGSLAGCVSPGWPPGWGVTALIGLHMMTQCPAGRLG